jgi:excisionase family DNA binding protein
MKRRKAPNVRSNRVTMSVEEVAEVLGIGRASAYAAVKSGQIPALRIGHRLVVPIKAFELMLASAEQPYTRDPQAA